MNVTEIPIDWSALTEEEQWEQILKESPEIPGLRNGIMVICDLTYNKK